MIPFQQALDQGRNLIAAWDDMDDSGQRLCLFAVGPGGASLASDTVVPPSQREETTDLLLDRGLRIGQTYGNQVHVWVMDDQGCSIWSDKDVVAEGNRAALRLGATWAAPGSLKGVTTFHDRVDRGHRGVTVTLAGGSRVTVVEERDETAKLDPTYNQDNLFLDGLWTAYLGRDLAMWLSLRHEDQIAHVDNADDLRISAAARALAVDLERVPETGAFEQLDRSIGVMSPAGEIAFRFASNPLTSDRRFLELRVSSPSGQSWSARWIRQGSNRRIAAFLREVRLPSLVLRTMNDLLKGQKFHGLA